jgi:hypothetical protein
LTFLLSFILNACDAGGILSQFCFLGKTIQHELIVDETSQQKAWSKGTVMSVISGNDGKLNAVYEVLYD